MNWFIKPLARGRLPVMALAMILAAAFSTDSRAFTLQVRDEAGAPVASFRWVVEEDVTYDAEPGVSSPDINSLNFHKSWMPVYKTGNHRTTNIPVPCGTKHFVSVMAEGYNVGGAKVPACNSVVRVTLVKGPVTTAQFSVKVFEDINPLNNSPDLTETGLEGFEVLVNDAGGRFGASGGRMMSDAFGNNIGTTYVRDANGAAVLNPDGTPQVQAQGTMSVFTDANGDAKVENLAPGKYGIQVIPPQGTDWQQVTTIEGSPVIDVWIRPNEPLQMLEFGPVGPHVFVGFTRAFADAAALTGTATVTGQVVNLHMSRPPDLLAFPGAPFPEAWVGVNANAGSGPAIWAGPADPVTGEFSIPGLAPGLYQLVVWDRFLDLIIWFQNFTVTAADATVALGQVAVNQWFTRLDQMVFLDENENGFMDPMEMGIMDSPTNLRWRDGTIYQLMPTDVAGWAPYQEIFPFFNWLVAEVGFDRMKATGATVVVDAGGAIDPLDPWSFGGLLTPQLQPDNNNMPYRTETGPVLLEGQQGFAGQTSVIQWGKAPYQPGENGGITGIVYYATTRAENDPEQATPEFWEPGIPFVQVNLYADGDMDVTPCGDFPGPGDIDWNGNGLFNAPDGVIDDVNRDRKVTLADFDSYPVGWSDQTMPRGGEDLDRDRNRFWSAGDAIAVVHTDSWDASVPTGCVGQTGPYLGVTPDCMDGLPIWNQVRPGVFDGGYAFTSYVPGGVNTGNAPVEGLPPGNYIVQVAVPPGYIVQRSQDKNVDFGQDYTPQVQPQLLPATCVGASYTVPPELSLFPGVEAPLAGQKMNLCDVKSVRLEDRQNAVADFHVFTEVPISSRITGLITNDFGNATNQASPNFGEKMGAGWVPVAFRYPNGIEITRTYTDEFGKYNLLVPSTYNENLPQPSGVAPAMHLVVCNARFMPDPARPGQWVEDPNFNPQLSETSYVFQFMPGVTTYLDTPVLPVAAHVGSAFPLDCEPPDGSPVIAQVNGPTGGPLANPGQRITLTSLGNVQVPNPAYSPGGLEPFFITRDYGFGAAAGTVTVDGKALLNVTWGNGSIAGTLPADATTGQLLVTRADGGTPIAGVTVHVNFAGTVHRVGANLSIQEAIDLAAAGDMVLVPPGIHMERVVLYKDVILQGYGSGSTKVNAAPVTAGQLTEWHTYVDGLFAQGVFDILPGQAPAAGQVLFAQQEAPGVMILGTQAGIYQNIMVDGLEITGAQTGGGIVVNGYVENLSITNNKITGNSGIFHGGIRVGQYDFNLDAQNDNVVIRYNNVSFNGGQGGAGGGIALDPGSDNYLVSENMVCGNFSAGYGGGIAHFGLSQNGVIEDNQVRFNESFNQGLQPAGGGIAVLGSPVPAGIDASPGTGSVIIDSNTIQGNVAGSGNGGGLLLHWVNGQDIMNAPLDPATWYQVDVTNNVIVNNVSGLAGGGISLWDAARVNIVHNIIANNDSTATAGAAMVSPTQSAPLPAGIVSNVHSSHIAQVLAQSGGVGREYSGFSNPLLTNNIIWQNRSFHWSAAANNNTGGLVPDPATPVFDDLAVMGTAVPETLSPTFSVLTNPAGYDASNSAGPPAFHAPYFNAQRGFQPGVNQPGQIGAVPAPDEGGNFIDLDYGPLGWVGDYHIALTSAAVDAADPAADQANPRLAVDRDGVSRLPAPDMGSYEATQAPANPAALGLAGADSAARKTSAAGDASASVGCFVDTVDAGPASGAALVLAAFFFLALGFRAGKGRFLAVLLAVALVSGLAFGPAPARAEVVIQCPPDTDGVDTDGDGIVDNDVVCRHLSAGDGFATMADGEPSYIFGFHDLAGVPAGQELQSGILAAEWPSPPIELNQGQILYLTLTNAGMMMRPDLFDPHTVHYHGFPQASSVFDGVPDSSIAVNEGFSLTYYYNNVVDGTFMYHCHVEATEHMQMGMLGSLWVNPIQNNLADGTDLAGFTHVAGNRYAYNDGDGSTFYNVAKPMQLSDFDPAFHDANIGIQPLPFALMDDRYPMINGRGYPDTVIQGDIPAPMEAPGPSQHVNALVQASVGDRILLRFINLSVTKFHNITCLGIPMRVVGRGAKLLRGPTGLDLAYATQSVNLGGGESKDVILDTTGVAPGTYYVFSTACEDLSNYKEDYGGMMTEIHLAAAAAPAP